MNDLARVENPGGMMNVASNRQAQEVQAAAVLAQKFPRDTTRAMTRILEECKRKSLAERAVYSYPRGGTTVSGPSIRLAETIARAWGNIDCGVVELEQKPGMGNLPGESVMQAYAWDLETNTRVTKVFTVKHKRDTKSGSKALTDERDIYEIAANNGARRLRACILSVIPADIVESAVEQCEKTMEGGQGPLIDRVRLMVLFFKEIGVSQEMIEKRLGHRIDVTTEAELVQLKKIATSLKDNFAKREDFFEVGPVSASPLAEQPQAPSQPAPEIKRMNPPNLAPQTQEEAIARQKQSSPQTSANTTEFQQVRLQLSSRINELCKKLGWNGFAISEFVKIHYQKSTMDLSNEEMQNLIQKLEENTNG